MCRDRSGPGHSPRWLWHSSGHLGVGDGEDIRFCCSGLLEGARDVGFSGIGPAIFYERGPPPSRGTPVSPLWGSIRRLTPSYSGHASCNLSPCSRAVTSLLSPMLCGAHTENMQLATYVGCDPYIRPILERSQCGKEDHPKMVHDPPVISTSTTFLFWK